MSEFLTTTRKKSVSKSTSDLQCLPSKRAFPHSWSGRSRLCLLETCAEAGRQTRVQQGLVLRRPLKGPTGDSRWKPKANTEESSSLGGKSGTSQAPDLIIHASWGREQCDGRMQTFLDCQGHLALSASKRVTWHEPHPDPNLSVTGTFSRERCIRPLRAKATGSTEPPPHTRHLR